LARWRINGKTKLTGIIGYPLEHTLSPAIHNAAFQSLELNWCYLPLWVKRENLPAALDGLKALNFVGVNVTMPYKEMVFPLMDEVVSYARMVGAVNTIEIKEDKLVGHNTDGQGFLTSLKEEADFEPRGKKIVLVGAGGAARAVAVSLGLSEIEQLSIVNRSKRRAEELCRLIKKNFPNLSAEFFGLDEELREVFGQADLIINATPVGMFPKKEEIPFPVEYIKREQLVFDLIYRPRPILLLQKAAQRGAKILDGLGMLIYQAAASFEIWTGLKPPIEVMRLAAIRMRTNG